MPVDPISLVSLLGSLATTAAKSAIGCRTLLSKFQDAPKALALIELECKTVKATLTFVSDLMLEKSATLSPRLDESTSSLSNLIDISLTGCTSTLGMLDGEIQQLGRYETGEHNDISWKGRVRRVWNENLLMTLCERLKCVKASLQLCISALQTSVSHPSATIHVLTYAQRNIVWDAATT